MKTKSKDEKADELRPEYDLAVLLKKGVRGKYAKRYEHGTNLVLLSPDVARSFPTDEIVNEALRLAMQLKSIPGVKNNLSTAFCFFGLKTFVIILFSISGLFVDLDNIGLTRFPFLISSNEIVFEKVWSPRFSVDVTNILF